VIPVIALVGRPNVGKSTLFNRLTKSRDAIVADFPGLTRDRQYGEARFESKRYIVIDTGGISGDETGIDHEMAEQSLLAIDEADFVLFLVDGRDGMTAADQALADHLRQQQKQVFVVVNKVDGLDPDIASSEFYQWGFDSLHGISASQGRGIKTLLSQVLQDVEAEPEEEELDPNRGVKIAVVGRPNVGKSTLVNRLLGEDRVVVYDQPGTTRDSIYIDYERDDRHYTLIDTAGIRRRKNIKLSVEKFSIVKTLQAISDAHVVVFLMDAHEGLVEQDMHLLGQVIDAGRALVVGINKWDGLDSDQKNKVKSELDRRFQFIEFAELHYISALHGTGVGHLYKSINAAYEAAFEKLKTGDLTRILEDAIESHPPPSIAGRRIKLRYAHAGGSNPPRIIIHGNMVDKVPGHYTRYLEKTFRRVLNLVGTPVKIIYKSGENPFAGRRNKLTPRQIRSRKRLIKHVKKTKK